jgi:hypothetical protein
MIRESIVDSCGGFEEILFADGFDDAIIGVCGLTYRVVYSKVRVIETLMSEDMSEEDAIEHAEFNIFNSYVGEQTPIFMDEIEKML